MQEALAFCMAGYVVSHSMLTHAVGMRIGLRRETPLLSTYNTEIDYDEKYIIQGVEEIGV